MKTIAKIFAAAFVSVVMLTSQAFAHVSDPQLDKEAMQDAETTKFLWQEDIYRSQ